MKIKTQSLKKSYPSAHGANLVLHGVDLQIEEGEFVAIVGPSGCGKSTLLHLIGGLDKADAGSIQVGGQIITKFSDTQLALYRRSAVGIVFQFFNLFSSLTVLENVLLPGVIRRDKSELMHKRALSLLNKVGLSHLQDARANQLSGGEMQRVALCRALLNRPALLLADEPTGNLDQKNREQIYALFKDLQREEKLTIVMVTHERELGGLVDRSIRMQDGKVVAC